MNADEFRRLALSLPEAVESSHMGHPDFRVRKKIFATLGHPDDSCGMVKLSAEQQIGLVAEQPETFEPVDGGWGRRGATTVHLRSAGEAVARKALIMAWRNVAPKLLARNFVDD